jgi:hypothetical protein
MEMSADQMRIGGIVLVSLVILVSGVWLSRSGRPFNGFILTVHKLIALGVAAYIAVTAYRTHQAAVLGGTELVVVVVTGILFLATGIIGGLLSTDKLPSAVLQRLHQITPALTAISTAATLYLLNGR